MNSLVGGGVRKREKGNYSSVLTDTEDAITGNLGLTQGTGNGTMRLPNV